MPLTPEDIVKRYVDDGSSTQRVAHRKSKLKMAVIDPNPEWPHRFQAVKKRVEDAIGSTAVAINHIGSTSIPGLPAKDVIDIDLVVIDVHDEAAYVNPLERADFRFLFREPGWHEHRFLVDEGDRPGSYPVNLHVFGPECPEVEKHRIFREWLLKTPEDLKLYASVKREAITATAQAGETMQEYTDRKNEVVASILDRAYRDLGYIK
jgi:GrpB-like predicted nucleotidyltransferase (UPF0157 family)